MPPNGRALSRKHAQLAVFGFLANDGRSWGEAMNDYNREHPKARYDSQRQFARDVPAAYKRVINATLRWTGKGDRPLTQVSLESGNET